MSLDAARRAISEHRFEDAKSLYAELVAEAANHDELLQYATALFRCGDYIEAAFHYSKAVSIKPNAQTHAQLAMALYKSGLFAEAINHFFEATKHNDSSGLRFNLGAAAERLGLFDVAKEEFDRALSLDPSNYPAIMGLCRAHRREGAYSDELRILLNARRQHKQIDIEISTFNALHRLGRAQEAMTVFALLHGILEPLPAVALTPDLAKLHKELWEILVRYSNDFGAGGFYQSFEELLVPGMRPTQARLNAYRILDVVDNAKDALDIGCNHGYLTIKVAAKARFVRGIDNSKPLIETAELAKQFTRTRNVEFLCGDAKADHHQYDVVLSCAVHQWIGMPLSAYIDWLKLRLRPSGHLLLESNDLATHDKDFDLKIRTFAQSGFRVIHGAAGYDDQVFRRRAVLMEREQ